MNRCLPFQPLVSRTFTLFLSRVPAAAPAPAAAAAAAMLGLALLALPAGPARAQSDPAQTQNEAAAGGRTFPPGTLRGQFKVINPPEIELDGRPERLSPGARIKSAQNMLVMPANIVGQNLLVNYTRDASGQLREVWVLTVPEARADRAGAERPLLNFWPFVATDSRPRDDGKTPFDQLPKYGQ